MDASQYADLFLTESREHVSAMNQWLLQLERDGAAGSAEPISAIFRAVHTVKGMSATMGYVVVAELSHELETLLDRVRRGELPVNGELMDLLFRSADVLESAIEGAVAGRDVSTTEVLRRLRAFAEPGVNVASDRSTGSDDASPNEWTAPAPVGSGTLVRIRLAPETPLKGVRAFLIVQALRRVGDVVIVVPPVASLQAEQFGHDFALRIVTTSSEAEIERGTRGAGDVASVRVGEDDAQKMGQAPSVAEARRAPSPAPATLPSDDASAPAAPIGDLRDEIMTSRMVPVWQVFDRFPRLVRDASRSLGKRIEFTIEGKDIELDRSMLDEIGDPIVHLLRNAIDHGIEAPEERTAAGKAPAGRLKLSAARDRSAVVIRVSDDGRGIDRDRVLARAKVSGLVDSTKAALNDEELLRLIARPGFSTAERITDLSGRGVGIDAVYTRVRALGGAVDIRSQPGQGTTATLRLPLTLAIVRALLARAANEVYAIPLTHVSETVELQAAALRTLQGSEVIVLRADVLPVLRLRDLVGLERRDCAAGARSDRRSRPASTDRARCPSPRW
ncbi:MAG: hypothetical protein DMD26_12110 [Gemmatimonadetes bacterium]|nr:MAG: hypothetical protein DMD26_12110 [Gemmatimonadota bacterium]